MINYVDRRIMMRVAYTMSVWHLNSKASTEEKIEASKESLRVLGGHISHSWMKICEQEIIPGKITINIK